MWVEKFNKIGRLRALPELMFFEFVLLISVEISLMNKSGQLSSGSNPLQSLVINTVNSATYFSNKQNLTDEI